MPDEILLNNIR